MKTPNSLTMAKNVASSEDFRGLLTQMLHYLKKMELELTCPNCFELLSEPTLLPCNHIFCSHCIRRGDDYRSNCLACPSLFAGGDRRHSIHLEAIIDIFKSLNDATAAIVRKLDSQVDTSGMKVPSHSLGSISIEAMKVLSKASPVFVSSQSEVPSKDAQFNVSGLKMPPKKITLSECNGANEDLQGSQFGIAEVNIPQKESCVSSTTNTKEALQERLASEEPGGRPVNNVYIQKPSDQGRNGELATVVSKNLAKNAGKRAFIDTGQQDIHACGSNDSETCCGHQGNGIGIKRLSMDTSQKENLETETEGKRGVLFPCADPCADPCEGPSSENSKHARSFGPSSQQDADSIRLSKRHKLDCIHGGEHDSHVLHDSFNLPQRNTEEKINTSSSLINHYFLVDSPVFEQQFHDLWMTSFGACNEWLLCGSDLSPLEEKLLNKFASLTCISVSRKWKRDVTHVIVSTDEHGRCSSTKNVLMAILSGKWVLKIDWVKACIEAKRPALEEPHEVSQIKLEVIAGSRGPKKGRLRSMEKAPKIFAGLSFYFGDQFNTVERSYLEELIVAAGGSVLKGDDMKLGAAMRKSSALVSSYIVYNADLPHAHDSLDLEEIARKRCDEAAALATVTGFMVIGHPWLMDAIATCCSADVLAKGAKCFIQ